MSVFPAPGKAAKEPVPFCPTLVSVYLETALNLASDALGACLAGTGGSNLYTCQGHPPPPRWGQGLWGSTCIPEPKDSLEPLGRKLRRGEPPGSMVTHPTSLRILGCNFFLFILKQICCFFSGIGLDKYQKEQEENKNLPQSHHLEITALNINPSFLSFF